MSDSAVQTIYAVLVFSAVVLGFLCILVFVIFKYRFDASAEVGKGDERASIKVRANPDEKRR